MNSPITADERSVLLASLAELPPKHWLKRGKNEVWHLLRERMRDIEIAIKRGDNATLMGRVLRDFYIKSFLIIRDNWGILSRLAEQQNHKELPPTPEETIEIIWQQECQLFWRIFGDRNYTEVSSTKSTTFYRQEKDLLSRIEQGDPEAIDQAQKDMKYLEAQGLCGSELLIWCIGTLMHQNNRKRDPALSYSLSEFNAAIANIHKASRTARKEESFAIRNGEYLEGCKGGYRPRNIS